MQWSAEGIISATAPQRDMDLRVKSIPDCGVIRFIYRKIKLRQFYSRTGIKNENGPDFNDFYSRTGMVV